MSETRTPKATSTTADSTTAGADTPRTRSARSTKHGPAKTTLGNQRPMLERCRRDHGHHDAGHDFATCPGCDRIMNLGELVIALAEPCSTLYKRATRGYPCFPKRLTDRHGIAVLCRNAKAYLAEVSQ